MAKKTKNPFGLESLDPITLDPEQLEHFCAVLAHFAATLDATIDEWDSFELFQQFLEEEGNPLDIVTVEDLALMCRATRLNRKRKDGDGGGGVIYN